MEHTGSIMTAHYHIMTLTNDCITIQLVSVMHTVFRFQTITGAADDGNDICTYVAPTISANVMSSEQEIAETAAARGAFLV
eukprot:12433-Heterococcus_DN1.PRE.5